MAHQTIRIQWFGNTGFTKHNKYNGLNAHGSPHITYKMIWGHMAHKHLQIQWFDSPWRTKRWKTLQK